VLEREISRQILDFASAYSPGFERSLGVVPRPGTKAALRDPQLKRQLWPELWCRIADMMAVHEAAYVRAFPDKAVWASQAVAFLSTGLLDFQRKLCVEHLMPEIEALRLDPATGRHSAVIHAAISQEPGPDEANRGSEELGSFQGSIASTGGDASRAEQERDLRAQIADAVEVFRAKYEVLTAQEIAWNQAVATWLPLWRAWFDDGPNGASPPVPNLAAPNAEDPAALAQRERELHEKRWAWRHLWAWMRGLIAWFQTQPASARDRGWTAEDRAWTERVARDLWALGEKLHRELALEHPGMPRVDNISPKEAIDALLAGVDGDEGPEFDNEDGEDDDQNDDELAARQGS
jgi:hypothetical protein